MRKALAGITGQRIKPSASIQPRDRQEGRQRGKFFRNMIYACCPFGWGHDCAGQRA